MSALDSSLIPGMTPPPGVTPNFVDPESVAPACRIITGVSLAMMYCFLVLRVYTRIWVTRSFGIDDFLCLVSAALATAFCAVMFAALKFPLGPHQWDVPLSKLDIRPIQKATLITISLYSVAAAFLKSTFLSLYLRIFQPAKGAKILLWTSLIVIVLFYITNFIVEVVICGPALSTPVPTTQPEAFDPDQGCSAPQKPLWITVGIFSIVSDFYLLAVPVGLTLNVRLPLKRKIGVCCMFLTGLLACALSIVSTAYRIQMLESADVTWLGSLVYAFTAAELNVGIACSCMPVIFVIFHNLTKSISWDSLARLITRQKPSHGDSVSKPSDPARYSLEDQLPEIPQISRIGLTSFMRKAHRSQSRWESRMSMYDELASMEYDYHAQLRKESSSVRLSQKAPASSERQSPSFEKLPR
ncbi:hypothetical protein F5Y06DRAFT_133585 [Hypoxylon sp. FL0890]|nr:hypothetical protein F5Y06DRAFT_133585 [Hypoxylon sp. FL0890]